MVMQNAILSPSTKLPKSHLLYLEGLRGAAALYVVMHHAMLRYDIKPTSLPQKLLIACFNHGHFAVNLFIVISGFSLMLPAIRKEYEVDATDFYKRRLRRILPPYYFALVFSVLMIPLYSNTSSVWTDYDSIKSFVLHVFLINDFFSSDVYTLNYSLWSIPVECRIYLFFPLLLLVWKKAGSGIALTLAFGLSAILGSVLIVLSKYNSDINITTSGVNPYIVLFALGMLAADLSFSQSKSAVKAAKFPWTLLLVLSSLVFIAYKGKLQYNIDVSSHMHDIIADILFGIVCFALLGVCANEKNKYTKFQFFQTFFSWRPLVFMGIFSYSIYLVHAPILQVLYVHVMPVLKLTPIYATVVLIIIGTVTIVSFAYLFFLAFEKPFLSKKRKESITQTAVLAIENPAI
jgi:peptidoglycan/LPS O-acetylase OafA/YrhL